MRDLRVEVREEQLNDALELWLVQLELKVLGRTARQFPMRFTPCCRGSLAACGMLER